MKKNLSIIEKYLLIITTFIFFLSNYIVGYNNHFIKNVSEFIITKNDILINVSSIFIGIYITLILMYPSYRKVGGLDELSNKNYFISYKYILYGMLFSGLYLLNFLLDDIVYRYIILNVYLFLLMFISFIRVLMFIIIWQTYDILIIRKKVEKHGKSDYEILKDINDRLKNIEDSLKIKK